MENNEFILIVGPMTSGKSKFLIDNYYGKEDIEAFSPTIDTRDAVITSRAYSDKHIPCTKITQPSEMLKSNKRTILLDEYQFLGIPETLTDTVNELKRQGKTIVFAGLDLLATREMWANYQAMRELCDREIQLRAKCGVCGKPTRFTSLISGNKNKAVQIEGEGVSYQPRCDRHWE